MTVYHMVCTVCHSPNNLSRGMGIFSRQLQHFHPPPPPPPPPPQPPLSQYGSNLNGKEFAPQRGQIRFIWSRPHFKRAPFSRKLEVACLSLMHQWKMEMDIIVNLRNIHTIKQRKSYLTHLSSYHITMTLQLF